MPGSGIGGSGSHAARCCFHSAGEGAVGQARREPIASGELGGGADEAACVAEDQGVAAIEDGQRRERVKAGFESAEVGGGGVNEALDGVIEACSAG